MSGSVSRNSCRPVFEDVGVPTGCLRNRAAELQEQAIITLRVNLVSQSGQKFLLDGSQGHAKRGKSIRGAIQLPGGATLLKIGGEICRRRCPEETQLAL